MAQPYVGEIRIFAGNFAPAGWAFCDGSLMAISQNDTLFSLIGTIYGGDGQNTFGLPDLRGRVPVHLGGSYAIGQSGGTEQVTLTEAQMPVHSHVPACNNQNGTSSNPANNFWAAQPALIQYSNAGTANQNMKANSLSNSGGSQAHNNMIPNLAVNYIISLFGIYPSRS